MSSHPSTAREHYPLSREIRATTSTFDYALVDSDPAYPMRTSFGGSTYLLLGSCELAPVSTGHPA